MSLYIKLEIMHFVHAHLKWSSQKYKFHVTIYKVRENAFCAWSSQKYKFHVAIYKVRENTFCACSFKIKFTKIQVLRRYQISYTHIHTYISEHRLPSFGSNLCTQDVSLTSIIKWKQVLEAA